MDKEAVKHKAYELWEADGRPHGKDTEHWRKAEALVAGKPSSTKPSSTKPSAPKSSAPSKTKAAARATGQSAAPKTTTQSAKAKTVALKASSIKKTNGSAIVKA